MSNYRDDLLAQLMFQQMYPQGDSEMIDGKKVAVAPQFQPNTHAERVASRDSMAQASLGEDAMLRNQLGKSKRKRRNEPTGHYSAVDYAGGPSPLMASHGVERGVRYTEPGQVMGNKEKMALADKGSKWYDHQMKMWGRSPRMQPKSYDQLRTANRAWRNR
jgi:hypothetical protein